MPEAKIITLHRPDVSRHDRRYHTVYDDPQRQVLVMTRMNNGVYVADVKFTLLDHFNLSTGRQNFSLEVSIDRLLTLGMNEIAPIPLGAYEVLTFRNPDRYNLDIKPYMIVPKNDTAVDIDPSPKAVKGFSEKILAHYTGAEITEAETRNALADLDMFPAKK